MQNIVELLALIAVAAILAWSAVRTWHAETRAIKWGGAGLFGGLSASAASVATLMSIGMFEQHRRSAPVPDVKVSSTPEMLARGKGIADGLCGACHSHTGTLTGGYDLAVELQFPIGSFVAANLTTAGPLKHWSDGEIFRAIRNGIDADGRWLTMMSYIRAGRWLTMMSYIRAGRLSDDDIKAVIAYIRKCACGRNPDAGSA